MTSRERVQAVLRRESADAMPIDFGGMRSTGIHSVAYANLLNYLNLPDEQVVIYDVFQQLAEPSVKVLDMLGADIVQLHKRRPAFGISIEEYKKSTMPDGSPCLVPKDFNPVENEQGDLDIILDGKAFARMPKGGYYFDIIHRIYENVQTTKEIEETPVSGLDDEDIAYMKKQAKHLYETTDKAILMEFGGNVFEAGQTDFGYEMFYMNIAAEPELMHYYFKRITDRYIKDLKKLMPNVHQYIDVIQFGDDLGTQISPQISLQMYREMIKPYHKRLYQFIRNNYPDVQVFLHSCGAIYDLLPDLVDAGVQILNPVQISAQGMDPKLLKEGFGKELIFWGGGANMQETVPSGTTEEIEREVAELIKIFNKNGGYVFNQVHNIQSEVSPEKIMAIYNTAKKLR